MSGPYCSCLTVHYAPVQTEDGKGKQERWACDCGATFFRRSAHAAEQVLLELAPERLESHAFFVIANEREAAAEAEHERVIQAVIRWLDEEAVRQGVACRDLRNSDRQRYAAAGAIDLVRRLTQGLRNGALAPYLDERMPVHEGGGVMDIEKRAPGRRRVMTKDNNDPEPQEPRVLLGLEVGAWESRGEWRWVVKSFGGTVGRAYLGYPTETEALAAGREWLRASLRLTLDRGTGGE